MTGGPRSTARPVVPAGLRRASEWSWRLLIVAAAGAVVVWALSQVFLVVIVVVAALLLTTLFNPIADALRRRGWPSGLATAAALITGLGVLALVGWGIGPPVVNELGTVGKQAAQGVRQAQDWLTNGPLHLSNQQVDKYATHIVDRLQGKGGAVVNGVVNGVVTAGEVIAAVLLTIVLTVFFVKDGRLIWGWLVGLLPADSRERADQVGAVAWETLGGYIRGIATIGLVDALAIGAAIYLLGVPLVLPLMALTFIGAFIPLVGSTLAGAVSALVALVDQGLAAALILTGVIIAVQQLEGHVLYPVVMRRAVHVHPVAILLGVAAGALLMGIFGAIIAVPTVAIAARVLTIVRAERADREPTPPVGDRAVVLDPLDGRPAEHPQGDVQPAIAASSRSTSS